MKPYNQSIDSLCSSLKTQVDTGLSSNQVKINQKLYGLNQIKITHDDSWILLFLRQFKSPLIYFLLIASTLIYFMGPDKHDAFIISAVLLFNAIVGVVQEGRTRSILDALRTFTATSTLVIRDGKRMLIPDKQLVPGDIIILNEGQCIGADARIINAHALKIDESSLSGESVPVKKNNLLLSGERTLFEQTNMIFQGTYIVSGTGTAVVVATGESTQLGKIHESIAETNLNIPLRQELNRLSYHILLGILGICILLLIMGLATGKPFRELLVMLTALFICVVPEGLPIVLTLVLVSGAYHMAKNKVLMRNLQAVEGLGRVDCIVIDKTGTLTRNEMMVTAVFSDKKIWHVTGKGYDSPGYLIHQETSLKVINPDSPLWYLGVATSLLNNAEIIQDSQNGTFTIKGDSTEAALYVLSQKLGVKKETLEKSYEKIYEIPFNSDQRYHAGFYHHDTSCIAFIVGSPEQIFSRCSNISADEEQILKNFLHDGLRVVAVALKHIRCHHAHSLSEESELAAWKELIKTDMHCIGLCGIEDALRAEVAGIVSQVRNAGLRVILATGDHKKTALHVAQKAGIYSSGDIVLEGTDLNTLSDENLASLICKVSVCARITPEQKIRLIKALQANKMLVAMAGDGINDAPALATADIGIGMGLIGTEIAKQASDIILLDDSFENVIKGIELGRHIFYTIRRVILYFFATNMAEVLIVMFSLILSLPLPITAAQILWLNLVTDGFLDSALAMEPQEGSLLTVRWHHLIDASLWLTILFMALPMSIGSLCIFRIYFQQDIGLAHTMTLVTMALFQWFNAWNCRSTTKSVFRLGFFSNPWLLLATSLVFILQFALLYLPFMQRIFKTVPLNAYQFFLAFAVASSVLLLDEIRKTVVRVN